MEYELKQIHRRRKLLGLTQHQLAKAAQVSQSLIAKIENSSLNDVAHHTAVKLFEALEKLEHKEEKMARDIMTKKIITININDLATERIKLMKEKSISQIPVIDRDVVVGRLTELSIIENVGKLNRGTKVSEIMAEAPPQVPEDMPLSVIVKLLKSSDCVLVTKHGKLAGIITKSDLLFS